MKSYTNTYKQDKNIKNLEFSKGEDITQQDIEIIKSRSTKYYVQDVNQERFWNEIEYSNELNKVQEWNNFELQYDSGDTFQIGNNVKGGI